MFISSFNPMQLILVDLDEVVRFPIRVLSFVTQVSGII